MKRIKPEDIRETMKRISSDRMRTNILRKQEQKAIAYLLQRIPSWVSPDMLTLLGFKGTLITFSGFILASFIDRSFLLLGVVGFTVNWFGDSLDGRLAYFRNIPRKWYGFTLDLTTDWISTILIGWGYVIYAEGNWERLGPAFVVMYGWAMIIALMRYKVTGKYIIDSGMLGPTELRLIMSLIFVAEVISRGAILYAGMAACILMLIINIKDTARLIKVADETDIAERARNTSDQNG
jgi:hypothetical protein